MTSIHLMGGGNLLETAPIVFEPFLKDTLKSPTVALVVLDEGDGIGRYERFAEAVRSVGPCETVPILIQNGGVLPPSIISGLNPDALLVCGGSTPGYANMLHESAAAIRLWLSREYKVYGGYSAGAVIASEFAILGGHIHNGTIVCPAAAAEDLATVAIKSGLGLVPWTLEPHGAAWGTIGRLIALVGDGTVPSPGLCIDEDTTLSIGNDGLRVHGLGCVHIVARIHQGVSVTSLPNGSRLTRTLEPRPGCDR